jgi:hydrogenase maturation protease
MSRVLVGGVGYRWAGDMSFGLSVSDMMAKQDWPDHVEVRDLGYGGLYVALDLVDWSEPLQRLILITALARGRQPGELSCTRYRPVELNPVEVQERVREAGGGVIDVDHLLAVAQWMGALPSEVFCIELEPVEAGGGESLSESAAAQLHVACHLARTLALGEEESDSMAAMSLYTTMAPVPR